MPVPDRQDKPYTNQSEQGVLNESRDEKYKVLAMEMVAENSTQDALVRLKTDETGALLTSSSGGGTSSVGGASEEQQQAQSEILEEIEHAVQAIASARGIASDLRVTLLGGTTAVTGTLTAVTTVTTVTGLTNIGGLPAVQLVPSNQNIAAVLTNINNITL